MKGTNEAIQHSEAHLKKLQQLMILQRTKVGMPEHSPTKLKCNFNGSGHLILTLMASYGFQWPIIINGKIKG